MEWIATLEPLALVVFLGSIVVNFALGIWNRDWYGFGAMLGTVFFFLVSFVHRWCFYNLVKCPRCSGKLNQFKNGKNVPMKQAYTQLHNAYGCRHCGWKPDVSEAGSDVA